MKIKARVSVFFFLMDAAKSTFLDLASVEPFPGGLPPCLDQKHGKKHKHKDEEEAKQLVRKPSFYPEAMFMLEKNI